MSKIKIITTNAEKQQYWSLEELDRATVNDCMHVINLYPELTSQKIEGFGGAFTEASAVNYNRLTKEDQASFIESYFGESGLRYNQARTTIHSCDFALGNYTYIDENDEELSSFHITHDEEQIIPMIKEAMKVSKEGITFLSSPWSPPAFMKTNGEMNNGGKLKKEYYSLWAKYFVKYIKALEEQGIKVSRVTVQNEPMAVQTWDSCIYTPEEEQEFVRDHLGPAFQEAGLDQVKIFVWDHNKEEAYNRVKAILEDEKAREYISGVALHWYTGDHFDAIKIIRDQFPEQEVFFTEGCVEYSRFADSGEVQKAEMYAHDMLGNLLAGTHGIIDWNLLLDENGGPNHVGNFCAAPIMLDGTSFEKRLSYYYIGQFSRYIMSGALRFETTKYTDKIEVAAFVNPNGERVVILLNKTPEKLEVSLRENGEGIEYSIEGHSIVTVVFSC